MIRAHYKKQQTDKMLRNVIAQIAAVRYSSISRSMNNRTKIITICIILTVWFLMMYSFIFDSSKVFYSKLSSQATTMIGINQTLHFSQSSNSVVSLELGIDCNLNNPASCFTANKSLVVSFWRDSSRDKWLAKNMLKVFPEKNFVRIIMVHDNSIWSSYPDKELFIWIYVNAQRKFWYVKRFLTPSILRAYKYIWILDDDVELLFVPLHYECVATQLNISFSSPGRLEGIASHEITVVDKKFVDKIGRWTDFIEIGPVVVGTSLAWECIWQFLSPFIGIGWGLDLIWCRFLAHNCKSNATMQQACAVLDIFQANHLANEIATTEIGEKETLIYYQYYKDFHTQQVNFAPLASDRTVYSRCVKS